MESLSNEVADNSGYEDSLHLEPIEIRMKTEDEPEETINTLPTLAMADGRVITENSACDDSLQLEPIEVRMKAEDEHEETTNTLPTIAMADGRVITEPSELEILHALDQKINRLERMTVGIFEIIRHLGVQVHGVSNHLANVGNKVEHLVQETSTNMGNFSVGQASVQGVYDQNQTSAFSGMNHNPSIPMSEVSSVPTDSSTRRLSWNERFEELRRYKDSNGHCDVPQIYDTGLGTWVSAQRSQFKRYIVGKTSSMTHQRKTSLDRLGFSWSLRKRFSWEERFSELKEFSETNGGLCDVPNEGDYKPLWTWCQNQKQAYKRGREGKSHPVAAERIALMEQIGFRWSTADYGANSFLPLSTPTEGSSSPMSDSICSEIGEL